MARCIDDVEFVLLGVGRFLPIHVDVMAKASSSFVCQNCGAAFNRWQGKCEACGEWNTLVEEAGDSAVPVSIRA